MECQAMLPRGRVTNGHGASLAPGQEPVYHPPGESAQQRGKWAGGPGDLQPLRGKEPQAPDLERNYIFIRILNKSPTAACQAGSGFYGNRR